jgi:hypothetical protein
MLVLGWAANLLLWIGSLETPAYLLLLAGGAALYGATWFLQEREQGGLTLLERQLGKVWGAFVAAAVLTHAAGFLLGLPLRDIFPFVVLQCGLAFACMATILGGSFYPVALACAVAGLLLARFPLVGPGVLGTLFAVGLLIPGWKHSRKAV